ncbi:MAG: alpha/beta fold hydrolase [Cyclobacteriaceae bacterium]
MALFYAFRNKVIFQSTPTSHNYQFKFSQPFQEYFIETNDGVELDALLFKSSTPSKGLIFYTHGNADNLQRWGTYAVDFTALGYDVLMYDYRGYGKSEGKSNPNNLYNDSFEVYNWAIQEFDPPKIILYGRSLGSTVASQLATKVSSDILILETPFAEFEDVVYWPLQPALYLFPNDLSLSNTQSLAKVTSPKFIFHGTNDWVVPLSSAEKLIPLLDQPDNFIIIEGAGHKNIRDFELYHTQLKEILK